jgi:hypothetical protein
MWVMKAKQLGGKILENILGLISGNEIETSVAGEGLSHNGNSFDVNVDNQSVEIDADTLQAKLDSAGAISKSAAGMKVNVDDQSVEIASNIIQAKLDPAGAISKSAAGMKVEVDDQSVEIASNIIQAKLDPAGAISKSAAGMKVGVDDSTIIIDSNKLQAVASPVSVDWSVEDNFVLDSQNPNSETTQVDLFPIAIESMNCNVSWGYDDYKPRTIGLLCHIGSPDPEFSFIGLKGRKVLFTAKDGSWFNIANLSGQPPPPGNTKPIVTRTESDVYEVTKALFSYSENFDAWILVSYERRYNWFKRYDIPPTPLAPDTIISGFVPSELGEGLPYKGFYEVDGYVNVREYEEDGVTQAITGGPQSISLVAGGWELPVDLSGNAGGYSPSPIYWFNNSLQGSAIVEITDDVCNNRVVEYRVTLPNGFKKQILNGYMHIRYIGKREGNNCIL